MAFIPPHAVDASKGLAMICVTDDKAVSVFSLADLKAYLTAITFEGVDPLTGRWFLYNPEEEGEAKIKVATLKRDHSGTVMGHFTHAGMTFETSISAVWEINKVVKISIDRPQSGATQEEAS